MSGGKIQPDRPSWYPDAVDLAQRVGFVTVSMIQRHFHVGYTQASWVVQHMVDDEIVSSKFAEGSVRQTVIIKGN